MRAGLDFGRMRMKSLCGRLFCLTTLIVVSATGSLLAGDQELTFSDLMKFRQIEGAVVSDDGEWVAYGLVPDRGDGETVVRSVSAATEFRIERGSDPKITADGRWAVAFISPTLEESEKAKAKKAKMGKTGPGKEDDKPKKGLALVNLLTGDEERLEKVKAFVLSDNGRWLAYRHYEEKQKDEEKKEEPVEENATEGEDEKAEEKKKDEKLGSTLKIRDLSTGDEIAVDYVTDFAFAEEAAILAYVVAAPEGDGNGAFLRDFSHEAVSETILHAASMGRYTHLKWAREQTRLAFVAAVLDEDQEPGDAEIWVWNPGGEATKVASRDDAPEGFTLPSKNELRWSRDGERLFFGFKVAGELFFMLSKT